MSKAAAKSTSFLGRIPFFSLASGFFLGSLATLYLVSRLRELEKEKQKKKARSLSFSPDAADNEGKTGGASGRFSSLRASQKQLGAVTGSMASLTSAGSTGNSGSFLSDLVAHLWPHIAITGSAMIKENVEPIFKDLPRPLSSLRFTKLDLGKVPICLDNFTVHDLGKGIVKFEMDILWDGDCEISLKCDIGSLGVESVKFMGRMTVLLKPCVDRLPIVSSLQCCFINTPHIDLDFTGLANLAEIGGIDKTVKKVIQDSFDCVVVPNRINIPMEDTVDYLKVYQPPLGVVRVTLVSGKDFPIERKVFGADDVPDVYCNIKMGNKKWKSSTIDNEVSPVFNETVDFILWDYDQIMDLEAWDYDAGALDPDDFLGSTSFKIGDLILAGGEEERELLDEDHKPTNSWVTLRAQLMPLGHNLAKVRKRDPPPSPKGKKKKGPPPVPSNLDGVLTILVTRAYNIPTAKVPPSTVPATFCAKVNFGEEQFYSSYVEIVQDNLVFDGSFHIYLTEHNLHHNKVTLTLCSYTDVETPLGVLELDLDAVRNAENGVLQDVRKFNDCDALVNFCVSISGVDTDLQKQVSFSKAGQNSQFSGVASSKTNGMDQEAAPGSGVGPTGGDNRVLVTAVKGYGFKIQKKRLRKDDIPDIYLKIRYGSQPEIWRTSTIKDDCSPVWNESRTYPMVDQGQVIHIDAYDENRRGADDYEGSARVTVGKILMAGGAIDLELEKQGELTDGVITLRCDVVYEF